MKTINLTSRETAPPRTISSHYYNKETEDYVGKFSEAYREAGHDFIRSFKVLRLAYLFKYHILTADDIFLYETLQLLCERGIPFTLERLAEEIGKGKATVRQCLDNLENGELLEILKSDGQGKPNFYVLRTPYFERESVEGDKDAQISVRRRIRKGGFDIPELFIETEHKRLKEQIKANRAKQLREVAKDKELQKKNPSLYKEFKTAASNRQLTWHKILKKLGSDAAATFDNLVFQLVVRLQNVRSTDYWREFRQQLKKYLSDKKINFDEYLIDYGVELAAFYDSRRATTDKPTAAQPIIEPTADVDNEREEDREFLTKVLDSRKRGERLKTLNDTWENLLSVFKRVRNHLSIAEIESLAMSYLTPQEWQKINLELRN